MNFGGTNIQSITMIPMGLAQIPRRVGLPTTEIEWRIGSSGFGVGKFHCRQD